MHQELVLQFASPVTETEAAAAAVPSQQRLSPPPMQPSWTAIPRLDDLRICIVGDSGLQLNKSKKNGDTATLETYVRAVLGPNTDAICFPGKGASCITRYVETARSSADAVVVVWFLNEHRPAVSSSYGNQTCTWKLARHADQQHVQRYTKRLQRLQRARKTTMQQRRCMGRRRRRRIRRGRVERRRRRRRKGRETRWKGRGVHGVLHAALAWGFA